MKNLIKSVVFLALGLVLFCAVIQKPFINSLDRIQQAVDNYYEEPVHDLDALYVGNSRVYTAWQPVLGWRDYGITMLTYATPNLPTTAYAHVIEETRRRQGNILFLFNLPAFNSTYVKSNDIHYTADSMPFSIAKIKLIKELVEINGAAGLDTLEYYIPFVRFHSAWKDLTEQSFSKKADGMKNSVYYPAFLKKSTSVTTEFTDADEDLEVITADGEDIIENEVEIYEPEIAKENLIDFLDYCEENSVKVLFINPPGTSQERSRTEILEEIALARGFEVLDITDSSEIGLDLKKDYYDLVHMNIHGSIKFTLYMGQYLTEHYDFENKHGDQKYASWDQAYEAYLTKIGPYVMDFEVTHGKIDKKIKTPKNLTAVQYVSCVNVKWDPSEKAEGYLVYRKTNLPGDTSWRVIAELDAETCAYKDEEAILAKGTYTYTVVPFRMKKDQKIYGSYSTKGVAVKVVPVTADTE